MIEVDAVDIQFFHLSFYLPKTMLESRFKTELPQIGRSQFSESHPDANLGSLTDSGGGKSDKLHQTIILPNRISILRSTSHGVLYFN